MIDYKDFFEPQNLAAPRVDNVVNDNSSQDQSIPIKIVSQCKDLICIACNSFQGNDFESYFNVIRSINKYYSNTDIDLILPAVFNPEFNTILINSLDVTRFNLENINEVLKLIYNISFFSENFYYFRNSQLFDIAYHLLELNNQTVSLECISIINLFMVIFQTIHFPYKIVDFLHILQNISNDPNIVEYVSENLKLLIYYIDVRKYLANILYLQNFLLPAIKTCEGIADIIESCVYIIGEDPLNFPLIFESRIIHTFIDLLDFRYMKQFNIYQSVILNFFQFICRSFMNIKPEWQEISMKVIGIDTLTRIYGDERINLAIHQILFQYLKNCNNIIEENPFFATILNRGFVHKLVKTFENQNFQSKKQILIVINKLLKTQNQELFLQLTHIDANYTIICSDFAVSVCDDIKIQKVFLKSLIRMIQISEKVGEEKRIIITQDIEDFIESCTVCEDHKVRDLAFYFYNITTK